MKASKLSIFFLALFLNLGTTTAQPEEVLYTYKKGQVVDFLFLLQKSGTEQALGDYFATVFPLVKDAGYRPLPGFRVSQSPTQGNYHPTVLAIASWGSQEGRGEAMMTIEEQVPDFHQRRREIWSSFAMTVYTMKDDVSFTVSSDKIYSLTAYWQTDDRLFKTFKQEWLTKTGQAGGRVQMELEDGESPFGYHYDPDYMAITEWDSRAAFEKFNQENHAMDHRSVQHVNQLILDLPPAKK